MFELPVLVYFFTKIGLISPEFLKRYRKHALVLVLILAAIITPPDVASKIIVAIPVLILYEFGLMLINFSALSIRTCAKALPEKTDRFTTNPLSVVGNPTAPVTSPALHLALSKGAIALPASECENTTTVACSRATNAVSRPASTLGSSLRN